jgi:hypothetical protein
MSFFFFFLFIFMKFKCNILTDLTLLEYHRSISTENLVVSLTNPMPTFTTVLKVSYRSILEDLGLQFC